MPKPTFLEPPATIQSQYAASPCMLALIKSFQQRLSPNNDITLFYKNIFNINTAEGIGLDIWGIILGISRNLEVEDEESFGFNGSKLQPFDQTPFQAKGVTNTYSMTDPAYRELLMIKALANISTADLNTLNTLLNQLFDGYVVYVVETGVMQLRFIFEFYPTPWQRAIFSTPGLLTRGAGVELEWFAVPRAITFGFKGSGFQPFGHGTFSRSIPIKVT